MDFSLILWAFSSMKPRFLNNCIFVNRKLRERKKKRKGKQFICYYNLDDFFNNFKGFWYIDVYSQHIPDLLRKRKNHSIIVISTLFFAFFPCRFKFFVVSLHSEISVKGLWIGCEKASEEKGKEKVMFSSVC